MIKEWRVWILRFLSLPGICPRSSFGQRLKESFFQWLIMWLKCIACIWHFVSTYRFMELELRYSKKLALIWIPTLSWDDGCFHLTENSIRNLKSWEIVVGLDLWSLSIISHYFLLWFFLCPVVHTPCLNILSSQRNIVPAL